MGVDGSLGSATFLFLAEGSDLASAAVSPEGWPFSSCPPGRLEALFSGELTTDEAPRPRVPREALVRPLAREPLPGVTSAMCQLWSI